MKIKGEKKKRQSVRNSKSEEVEEEQPSITEQNKLKQKQLPSHSDSDSDPDYGSPYVSDSEVIISSLSTSIRHCLFLWKKIFSFAFSRKFWKQYLIKDLVTSLLSVNSSLDTLWLSL